MSVNLVTWGGQLVTPRDDALVYEVAVGESGIIYGADVAIKNSNTLHIAGGHGIICGRKFTIEEQDISVVLPSAGTQNGRLYLHLDLSNTTEPISFKTEIAATLTPEVQDENVNITMGVYDVNLVTFTASTTAISALVDVAPVVDSTSQRLAAAVAAITQQMEAFTTAKIAEANAEIIKNTCHTAYRGKNLGTSFTAAQAAAIAAGDFSDLWNGDYWEINGHRWRIVDNTGYFRQRGDEPFRAYHLVIMPDDNLLKGSTTRYMKDTNDTTGGYTATKYRQTYRAQCKAQFTAAFGAAHIANFPDLQTNSMENGHAASWVGISADVELPNEASVYGTIAWGDGYGQGYNTAILNKQFALFDIAPEFLIAKTMDGKRETYWLRDVVSAEYFAAVNPDGCAYRLSAAGAWVGIRPFAVLV